MRPENMRAHFLCQNFLGDEEKIENLNNIVVLIDADNTQLSKLDAVIREISTHGRIVVKRAYGNWKKETLKYWENELNRLAIKAEQQFDYATGKNATDMALVIDTMNLLHRRLYDAFVIVASDSDYTPLAINLHESGVYVMGVGEKKTPEAFRNSCDEFIFLENLAESRRRHSRRDYNNSKNEPSNRQYIANDNAKNLNANDKFVDTDVDDTDKDDEIEEIHNLLKIAFEKYQDDDGYVNLASAGSFLKRAKPDFDSRTFGFLKLPHMIRAYPDRYEMKRYPGKGTATIVAYRCR